MNEKNINNILRKILENTEEIVQIQKEHENLQEEISVIKSKEEKRKEQIREAQKNFKKIGFNCKKTYIEDIDKMLIHYDMNSSQFVKNAIFLLLIDKEFNNVFREKLEEHKNILGKI